MERAHQGADINYGSREGTLIHEISHAVAETGDECVSRADCRGVAGRSPAVATTSANTYESFCRGREPSGDSGGGVKDRCRVGAQDGQDVAPLRAQFSGPQATLQHGVARWSLYSPAMRSIASG